MRVQVFFIHQKAEDDEQKISEKRCWFCEIHSSSYQVLNKSQSRKICDSYKYK